VKDKSWRPCEKTRLTAVDVATKTEFSVMIRNEHNKLLARDAEVIQRHTIKVRIDVTVSHPPLERILHVLDWFAEIRVNLACPRSNGFGYRNIREGSKIVVVVVVL
jgi:hypothetical protein